MKEIRCPAEEKWKEFFREINIIPQDELTKIEGVGPVHQLLVCHSVIVKDLLFEDRIG